MRVLYFIPRYDSAAMGNRIHTEIIAEWRASGITADVLTLTSGINRIETTRDEAITVHRLPAGPGPIWKAANRSVALALPYPYLASAAVQYRRFMRANAARYDLVHIETAFPLGLIAATVPAGMAPPLAITLPGADIMAEPAYDYGYGRFHSVRALLPHIFRRAAVLRADSPQIRDLAIIRGAEPQRVSTIPYNITVDSFPPADTALATMRARSRAQVIARHNLDPQRPIVISLNRLHPFKGIAYLVEALPSIRQAGIAPQLLIVGPNRSTPRFGDYGAYLQQRAEALQVTEDVHLIGGIAHTEAAGYLAAADVAAVPSVAESFSRVVVEAAAVGTPTIVTRTTGVSAYVAEHQAGLVVAPRSGPAIGAALAQILGDPAAWEGFSRRSAAMAPAFGSRQIAADLLDLYRQIPIAKVS
jgi:glycosyltransferase involved in cell wall biosynthesis